ncbi:hypothetical protein KO317_00565 [Candidatus Micrarchaeota archaeon]|nr:hypothetical protein [Candidatus Micrarchaeota archaeon]
MKCTIHTNRDAVGKCSICKKPFCDLCLESLGEKRVCFKCLEKVAKKQIDKSKYNPYKSLNFSLLVSIACFALIFFYMIFLSLPILPEAFTDLYSLEAKDFMVLIGKAVLIFIEILLIYLSSSIAFILGLLIVIGLIVSPFIPSFIGSNIMPEITTEVVVFHIILPILCFIGLLIGKKGLSNKN